ncbi:MAG: hypothetical protein EXR21_01670 [Flavobacteriaceae bacterium]|nr:hypothetical protein [Flavobacteriaceae bacterium]
MKTLQFIVQIVIGIGFLFSVGTLSSSAAIVPNKIDSPTTKCGCGDWQDIVRLENGSTIKGNIQIQADTNRVLVEIMGGSVFVFPKKDILEIYRERGPCEVPKQGYSGFIGFNAYFPQPGISFNTWHGYRFMYRYYVGLGMAATNDYGNWYTNNIAFYAHLQSDILKRLRTASVFADIGTTIPGGEDVSKATGYKPGWYLHSGVLWKVGMGERVRTNVGIGYMVQTYTHTWHRWWDNADITDKYFIPSITLNLGLSF